MTDEYWTHTNTDDGYPNDFDDFPIGQIMVAFARIQFARNSPPLFEMSAPWLTELNFCENVNFGIHLHKFGLHIYLQFTQYTHGQFSTTSGQYYIIQ